MEMFFSLLNMFKDDNIEVFNVLISHHDLEPLSVFNCALAFGTRKITDMMIYDQIPPFSIYEYDINTIIDLVSMYKAPLGVDLTVILDHYGASACHRIKYDIVIQLIQYHPNLVATLLTTYNYNQNRIIRNGMSILSMSIIYKHKALTDLLLSMNSTIVDICKYCPDGKLLLQLIHEHGWIDTFDTFIKHSRFNANYNEKILIFRRNIINSC